MGFRASFSPADRDGKVEHREHDGPLLLHVEVSDDGWGDGGVAGLPHTHQAPGQQQSPETLKHNDSSSSDRHHDGMEGDLQIANAAFFCFFLLLVEIKGKSSLYVVPDFQCCVGHTI